MEFIDKIMNGGFTLRDECDKSSNPLIGWRKGNGWHGCTAAHPDVVFINGDKLVYISLQGVLMSVVASPRLMRENAELLSSCSARYLCLRDGDKIVYETMSGVLPSDDVLEEFIK